MWYLAVFSTTGPIFAFACKTVQSLHNPNNTKSLKLHYFEIWYTSANIAEIDRSILLEKVALLTILQPTLSSFIEHSNTPSLYTPMVKCSDILNDKLLGGLV